MRTPGYDIASVRTVPKSVFAHPFVRYVQRIKENNNSDNTLSGASLAKLQTLWGLIGLGNMADRLLQEPGNRVVDYDFEKTSDKGMLPKVGLGKPIDYDVWYLFWAGNILRKGHADFSPEEWITRSLEKMVDYFHEVDPSDILKALKQPVQDENVGKTFTYPESSIYPANTAAVLGFASMSAGPISRDNIADWKYTIKEAWFETILESDAPFYPSLEREKSVPFVQYVPPTSPEGYTYQTLPVKQDEAPYIVGPKEKPPDGYAGYIAFPVGAMGVMWQMAVTTASALTRTVGGVHPADALTSVVSGNELYPPFDLQRKDVGGHKVLDKGYLVSDNTTVEYPAQPFPDIGNPKAHGWFRYWIKKNNVEIIPGELVALVCRPYPNHCWWFQESSPFVYAGNWIETEFYTSGVVKEVLEPWTDDEEPMPSSGYYDPDEQVSKGVDGNHYRVWVKNEELILESSDFLVYAVDDKVGILKTWRDQDVNGGGYVYSSDAAKPKNFNWMDLQFFNLEGKNTDDNDLFITDWVLVPVAFYESSGNSMGGA